MIVPLRWGAVADRQAGQSQSPGLRDSPVSSTGVVLPTTIADAVQHFLAGRAPPLGHVRVRRKHAHPARGQRARYITIGYLAARVVKKLDQLKVLGPPPMDHQTTQAKASQRH